MLPSPHLLFPRRQNFSPQTHFARQYFVVADKRIIRTLCTARVDDGLIEWDTCNRHIAIRHCAQQSINFVETLIRSLNCCLWYHIKTNWNCLGWFAAALLSSWLSRSPSIVRKQRTSTTNLEEWKQTVRKTFLRCAPTHASISLLFNGENEFILFPYIQGTTNSL